MSNKQLRKEVNIDIPYVSDEGVAGNKSVHVTFISTRIHRAYSAMMSKVYDIIELVKEVKQISQDMGTVLVDKYDIEQTSDGIVQKEKITLHERRARYKELEAKYNDGVKKLQNYNDEFFNEKFNIIKMILVKNGITDSDLLSKTWWEDCVDMHDLMAFIETACTKDDVLVDQKKKEWSK